MDEMELMDAKLVEGLKFVTAKSMPNIPHQYVVRNPQNEEQYANLFHTVKEHGTWEKFYSKQYQYLYLNDGYKYWVMADDLRDSKIINRAKVD
jgi:hypothetical protein